MAEKKANNQKQATAVKFESKKPKKKGSNSGAALEQRVGIKNNVGMMARYCDSTYKDIENALFQGAKYEGEVNRFPKEPIIHFNEKTREIDCMELSELRKIERALQKHSKELDSIWKQVRPARKVDDKKKTFDKRKVNPANPFQKENRVNKAKSRPLTPTSTAK